MLAKHLNTRSDEAFELASPNVFVIPWVVVSLRYRGARQLADFSLTQVLQSLDEKRFFERAFGRAAMASHHILSRQTRIRS